MTKVYLVYRVSLLLAGSCAQSIRRRQQLTLGPNGSTAWNCSMWKSIFPNETACPGSLPMRFQHVKRGQLKMSNVARKACCFSEIKKNTHTHVILEFSLLHTSSTNLSHLQRSPCELKVNWFQIMQIRFLVTSFNNFIRLYVSTWWTLAENLFDCFRLFVYRLLVMKMKIKSKWQITR